MRHLGLLILITGMITCASCSTDDLHEFSREENKMGTIFQVTALASNTQDAESAVDAAYAEIDRIEGLISSWDPDSETSAINRNAGIEPVKVSRELFDLIYRSIKVSNLTQGIFDISYASLDAIWKFDGSMEAIPTDEAITRSIDLVGFENIVLDSEASTVFLSRRGMKIGFGAIGKGYAANRCKQVMLGMGIENGVVNAGGDLVSWGRQASGEDWTIGIVNPDLEGSALSWLSINDMAVVTSGNYERFVEFDGKQYSHIIDPRSGWPAEALKSVTIICPDAEVADALATSIFIMGVEEGIAFVNRVKDVECFIIDLQGNLHHSENISLNYYKDEEK